VQAARAKLAALNRGPGSDPAAERAAAAEVRRAEEACRMSVEAHVRAVAAAMDPAQGARYLAMVLPRLAALDHAGPPNARLDPTATH
jgi:uncharacterized membrane protein